MIKNENKKDLKFAIYARKSSEAEDKQVQSIDNQIELFEEMAKEMGASVKKIFQESKSAKDPYQRPEFEKLISMVESGEIDAILTWKINRLARNPVDGGRVQWLLQQGKLKSIQTHAKEYVPEENTLVFSVETGMSTQYVIDLSKDVKRGQRKKFDKGIFHGMAPTGYINTKTELRGENYILKDPERFPLIKKAWDLMLTGKYTSEEIRNKLNEEWGYRSLKRRKQGGTKMPKASMYKMFSNDFYSGIIHSEGRSKVGTHEPMVTLEEFDSVQYLLGRKTNPKVKKHEYSYNGVITCGECGGFVSATTKDKYNKKGVCKTYTLYYCSNSRKKNHTCSQKTYTNVDIIEDEIKREISKISINDSLKKVLLHYLELENETEITDRNNILSNQQSTLSKLHNESDNLNRMRMKDMIDDEWFGKEKDRLNMDIVRTRESMKLTEVRIDNWDEVTRTGINFAYEVKGMFESPKTTHSEKKEILSTIGLNCSLKDKKLNITKPLWLKRVEEQKDPMEKEIVSLELKNSVANKGKAGTFVPTSPTLRNGRDSNSQPSA